VIFCNGQKIFFRPETAAYFFRFRCHLLYDNHGPTMDEVLGLLEKGLGCTVA
jgi:hypothetical protein